MRKLKDLSGMTFGKLTVICRTEDYVSPSGQHLVCYKCQCECGNQTNVIGCNLIKGNSTTCGCSHRSYNKWVDKGTYFEAFTSNGKSFYIDYDDFDRVSQYTWHFNGKYVEGWVVDRDVRLHRFIMNCPNGFDVDHVGGDGTEYDNRKCNLRIATKSENSYNQKLQKNNTSGVTGVNWDKKNNKWKVRIGFNGKRITIGYYDDFNLAVQARQNAEEKYHREYSYNYSQELYKQANINA